MFTIYQLAILDKRIGKGFRKIQIQTSGYNSDFFLSDPQITKQDKDWLYPQMIKAIKKVKDSIVLVFSPTSLPNIMNLDKLR